MENIYEVMYSESDRDIGIVDMIEGDVLYQFPHKGYVQDWTPMTLEVTKNTFTDYLCGMWRICSEKFKIILEENASPKDVFQWLDIYVRHAGEERKYYILHFPEPADVLDYEKSLLNKGKRDHVIKPFFSDERCRLHNVFTYPYSGILSWFVKESIKKTLERTGCTGMSFSKRKVV